MSVIVLTLFLLGLVLLILGAEALVRGASRLAAQVGISPLVIGLTVVAFGTSSPELAVSVQSGWSGQADIAMGNIVGSNIFNVLFILGISAAITPLAVSKQLIRLDVPIMIGVSALILLLGLDGRISRWDGAALFAGIVIYTVCLIYLGRKEKRVGGNDFEKEYGKLAGAHQQWASNLALILGGLFMLVLGSRWLVNGAVVIAEELGVSQLVIGLTIVAAGTSLPEVATSILASLRGEREIAVGNVVGSNIFNILSVLGLASAVSPYGIHVSTSALHFDIPVMLASALACLPIFFTGRVIARWEGLLFFGYYIAYTTYLILNSTAHAVLPIFSAVMLMFVIPITVITLFVLAWRARTR